VTATALSDAARELRVAWKPRSSLFLAAFIVAALAPLVADDAETANLAAGGYLACGAIALAFVVGVAGLPSLAQGGLVAIGAVVGAHLLEHGVPTIGAAVVAGIAGCVAGGLIGLAFSRLPHAGFAAATWIVTWLIAFAAQSIDWVLGGSQGIVISGGPTPTGHYELALFLTALAGAGYAALARGTIGLRLTAAREREQAATALGVPAVRLRTTALAAAGAVAGVTGALAVQLAGVADPASFGPYLSFKLFVVVLLGGAVAPLGAPAGVLVLGVLSVLADAAGSLENVAASRAHALLASIMLLAVVSLGWDGVVRPARARRRSAGSLPPRPAADSIVAVGLTKQFAEIAAADDVSVAAAPGSITALVGPNGSGKTTVLRLLAGAASPDAGHVEAPGGVVRTLQSTAVFSSLTALEHVLVGSARRRRRGGFLRTLLSTPQARAEDAAFVAEAERLLHRFGLPPDTPAAELSSGERRVLMLAAAYATGAPVLLVDEPTAGTTPAESARLVELLRSLRDEGLALVVVEHNFTVVRLLADRVIVMDGGRVIADGPPDQVAGDARVRATYLGQAPA